MGFLLGPWYKHGPVWQPKRGRGNYGGEGVSRPIRAADDSSSKTHEDAFVSIAHSHSSSKMQLIEREIHSIRPSFQEFSSCERNLQVSCSRKLVRDEQSELSSLLVEINRSNFVLRLRSLWQTHRKTLIRPSRKAAEIRPSSSGCFTQIHLT